MFVQDDKCLICWHGQRTNIFVWTICKHSKKWLFERARGSGGHSQCMTDDSLPQFVVDDRVKHLHVAGLVLVEQGASDRQQNQYSMVVLRPVWFHESMFALKRSHLEVECLCWQNDKLRCGWEDNLVSLIFILQSKTTYNNSSNVACHVLRSYRLFVIATGRYHQWIRWRNDSDIPCHPQRLECHLIQQSTALCSSGRSG